jgi:hypothetical protein
MVGGKLSVESFQNGTSGVDKTNPPPTSLFAVASLEEYRQNRDLLKAALSSANGGPAESGVIPPIIPVKDGQESGLSVDPNPNDLRIIRASISSGSWDKQLVEAAWHSTFDAIADKADQGEIGSRLRELGNQLGHVTYYSVTDAGGTTHYYVERISDLDPNGVSEENKAWLRNNVLGKSEVAPVPDKNGSLIEIGQTPFPENFEPILIAARGENPKGWNNEVRAALDQACKYFEERPGATADTIDTNLQKLAQRVNDAVGKRIIEVRGNVQDGDGFWMLSIGTEEERESAFQGDNPRALFTYEFRKFGGPWV